MTTGTETQTARRGSKRAQLNKEKREDKNKSRVPAGQISGGGANLAFDNTMKGASNEEDGAKKQKRNNLERGGVDSNAEASGAKGLNYRQVMAKEKKRQKKKASKKQKKKGAVYQGSKKALTAAWESLIPSWLTTIFLIDILAFMHLVLPKFFCALGEEWESPMAAVAGGNKGSNTKSTMMKTVEPWIVVLINLIVLGVIAIILSTLALLVGAINDPIGFAAKLMGDLWDYITSTF